MSPQEPQAVVWQAGWVPPQSTAEPFTRRGGLLVPAGLEHDDEPVTLEALPVLDIEQDDVTEFAADGEDLVDEDALELPETPGSGLALITPAQVAPAGGESGTVAQTSRGVWRVRRRSGESAEQVYQRLEAQRDLTQVERDDLVARRVSQAQHAIALADVDEQVAAAQMERDERARDAAESLALAALHRRAGSAGERARVRAMLAQTAEMRALRVAAVQKASLWVGLVLLIGFGLWSMTGVHAGLVRLLALEPMSVGWWTGWLLEPLLIAIVAGLIVLRAVLRMSGGDVDGRARAAEVTALAASLGLNMFGGWHPGGGFFEAVGQALAHSVGAIGAAGTAWLIGVVIDYTSAARPWDGAPRVADLALVTTAMSSARPSARPSATASGRASDTSIRRGKRPSGSDAPASVQTLLPAVQKAIADGLLPPDPSGYAIYKNVMGGSGDRNRSSAVAREVRGWRPPLRAVDGTDSVAG